MYAQSIDDSSLLCVHKESFAYSSPFVCDSLKKKSILEPSKLYHKGVFIQLYVRIGD